MSDIYFTSDTHFNHSFILNIRNQFSSLDEMNETIIARWNSRVTRHDIVYHLGDVALGRAEEAIKILERLNGQIFLIRGNHERVAEHKLCVKRFGWIKDYHRVKIGEQKIYLFHYAMRTWNCSHHGSWSLYRHSHGSLRDDPNARSLDVGVDCWDFYPVSFEEIAKRMSSKRFVPVDHHTEDLKEN